MDTIWRKEHPNASEAKPNPTIDRMIPAVRDRSSIGNCVSRSRSKVSAPDDRSSKADGVRGPAFN